MQFSKKLNKLIRDTKYLNCYILHFLFSSPTLIKPTLEQILMNIILLFVLKQLYITLILCRWNYFIINVLIAN